MTFFHDGDSAAHREEVLVSAQYTLILDFRRAFGGDEGIQELAAALRGSSITQILISIV